jgi:hypothetical protein
MGLRHVDSDQLDRRMGPVAGTASAPAGSVGASSRIRCLDSLIHINAGSKCVPTVDGPTIPEGQNVTE